MTICNTCQVVLNDFYGRKNETALGAAAPGAGRLLGLPAHALHAAGVRRSDRRADHGRRWRAARAAGQHRDGAAIVGRRVIGAGWRTAKRSVNRNALAVNRNALAVNRNAVSAGYRDARNTNAICPGFFVDQ